MSLPGAGSRSLDRHGDIEAGEHEALDARLEASATADELQRDGRLAWKEGPRRAIRRGPFLMSRGGEPRKWRPRLGSNQGPAA